MEQVKFFWEEPIDVSLIAASWEAAFRRPFDAGEWDWRFGNQPLDNRILAAYILKDGKVACFVAHTPVEAVSQENALLKAGLMLMGFTHPDYQGMGLFTRMSRVINSKLASLGFDFIFAFANNNSHYTNSRNLNWRDIGILTCFTLDTESNKMQHLETAFSVSDLPLTRELTEQLSLFTVCYGKCHMRRSSSYLNWRLLQHSTKIYRSAGIYLGSSLRAVAIYKTYNNTETDIMEIFYAEESDLASEHILSALVAFLTRNDASKLNIWSNLFSGEHLCLEKLGFAEDRFSAYFGLIKLNNQSVSTQISDWHYRFLDSDVY